MCLRPPLLLLALCWSVIVCALPARAQESSGRLEEWIYELRAGQFARRTVIAYADDNYVLIPVGEVLSMLEIGFATEDSGAVRARIEHSRTELLLDPTVGLARRDERVQMLPIDARRWIGPELFLDARLFAQWLGVECYLDPGELRIVFDPVYELPIGQRILRERDRYGLLHAGDPGATALELPNERGLWEGGVLDWRVSAPEPTALEQSSLGGRFGGSLAGGSLDLGASGRLDGVGEENFDGVWHGVWPKARFVRQLALGDAATSSPHSRAIRGISVGNAPFVRRSRFGMVEISGVLEAGWEVEAHRLGRLVAFQQADEDGRYRFELPLDYGQNPVEIRAFGPHGEMRVLEHAARVDFDRLPQYEFEWGASSGRCEDGDCDVASNVDLRYGLHRNWTVRAGVDLFHRDALQTLDHPYLGFSGSPHPHWQLRAENVWDAWRALRIGYEPSARLRGSLDWQRFDDRLLDPILQPDGDRHFLRLSLLTRPRAAWRGFFVHGDLQHRDGSVGERIGGDLGFSQIWNRWRLRSNWQHRGERSDWFEQTRDRLQLTGQRSYFRAGMDFDLHRSDDHHFSAGLSRRLGHATRAELGVRVSPMRDDVLVTLSILSTTSNATLSSSASRYGDGSYSSQNRAEGSILYERASERFHFEPYRSLGRGGVQGTVFLDENFNGRRDPEESGIGGVRVFVGPMLITTDGLGRYSAWQLMPFEDGVVRVDPESIPDPLMVPVFESAATAILPNGYATVDIPVVAGAEISGLLSLREADGSLSRLGALPVELLELDSGAITRLRAFDDGEYYLLGLAPGRYQARIPEHVLQRAGWRMLPSEELKIAADRMGERAFQLDVVVEATQ